MITHAGARTRALYDWERQDLDNRVGVVPVSPIEAWDMILTLVPGWQGMLEIRDMKGYPRHYPNHIILTVKDHYNLTLIHELSHIKMPGHHTVGFVKKYIKLMNAWFGWEEEELEMQANWRGLL